MVSSFTPNPYNQSPFSVCYRVSATITSVLKEQICSNVIDVLENYLAYCKLCICLCVFCTLDKHRKLHPTEQGYVRVYKMHTFPHLKHLPATEITYVTATPVWLQLSIRFQTIFFYHFSNSKL